MAGYKIMPSLQAMFNALTQLKFTKETVNKLYKDYHQVKNVENGIKKELKFESDIKLNSIDYSFDKEGPILNHVSMEIIKGTYVAIIGKTGCGKSTLIDILMGLLEPKNGEIYIDEVKLEEIYYRSWREKIGYVPQQIPLTDSTILKNILLGTNDEDMHEERIQEVIELSCLTEVIDSLENGLESEIGEGGIKLSGGQKQRIGIARALYKRPSILILDEATSAMDQKTESIVIENLKKIKDITIISITHRLSTIKDCDNIFIIENGVLVESGSYNQIKKTDFFNRISTDIN
jgi:ABC-type bacteriocin/lantibiotic exporter with double-glycine peptidase domain